VQGLKSLRFTQLIRCFARTSWVSSHTCGVRLGDDELA
jgi:hypothetical protein